MSMYYFVKLVDTEKKLIEINFLKTHFGNLLLQSKPFTPCIRKQWERDLAKVTQSVNGRAGTIAQVSQCLVHGFFPSSLCLRKALFGNSGNRYPSSDSGA